MSSAENFTQHAKRYLKYWTYSNNEMICIEIYFK